MMNVTIAQFMIEAEEIKNGLNEMIKENIDVLDLDDTDMDALKLFAKCMKFTDVSLRLVVEQAEAIDRIEEKLDRIIAKENSSV